MAVQAQFPSNVFLLNRNMQDQKRNSFENDYSFEQQQTGEFLNQSHMLFNNNINGVGSNNPRKRGREEVLNTAGSSINMFSQPLHRPTLVNLPQVPNNQHLNMVSTGLQLAFQDQQQIQNNQQQQKGIVLNHPSSILQSILSDDLSAQMKQDGNEIDQFLQTQGDQLRRMLAEERGNIMAMVEGMKESGLKRLREKEIDLERATRKNSELEARTAQLRLEAHVWQSKAKSQREIAEILQVELQNAIMNGCVQDKRDEGGSAMGEAEDAESAYVDPERVVPLTVSTRSVGAGPSCKACRKRIASVVILPCRHLCVCTECDTVVNACPLCLSFRNASVEVFLS